MVAPFDSSKPAPPPMPVLNGGLYTGEPFAKDAPYANIPLVPDAGYMTHYNLKSANPPDDARYQYPGGPRPGNNVQPMPGIQQAPGPFGLYCSTAACSSKAPAPVFSKYYHLVPESLARCPVPAESSTWHPPPAFPGSSSCGGG